MAGYSGLVSRLKKCQSKLSHLTRKPIRSVVFVDREGNMIIEEGVEYNERGVLAIPQPMDCDEWEQFNMECQNRFVNKSP